MTYASTSALYGSVVHYGAHGPQREPLALKFSIHFVLSYF